MVKANVSEIERLMELNEFTNSRLSKEAKLRIPTIKRVLSGRAVTLRSVIKISIVLKCSIRDILLKTEMI
jgi:hypothetical protein